MQINRSILVRASYASIGDYVALMKPRVMSLVVFTALVGLMVAPGDIDPFAGAVALFCIAAGAGAAGALNMWSAPSPHRCRRGPQRVQFLAAVYRARKHWFSG